MQLSTRCYDEDAAPALVVGCAGDGGGGGGAGGDGFGMCVGPGGGVTVGTVGVGGR